MAANIRGRPATLEEKRAVIQAARRGVTPFDELGRHFQQVPELKPELCGVDLMSFLASVTTGGVVTQPSHQNVPGGYLAELIGLRGCMQKPSENPDFAPYITFNVKDRNRGYLFTTDIEMAYIVDVTAGGRGETLYFPRGLYVFDPGTTIEVPFATTSSYTGASAVKRWGVLLMFNLWAV